MDTPDKAQLKEGYVLDKITKTPVDFRKPEEKVRQEYEEILYKDYEYQYGQMDIEVPIQRGEAHSLKNRAERADIVIYQTSNREYRDPHKDIIGIIETKRPSRKEGVKQLESYMSATSSNWGVWTNGSEIEYLCRNPVSGIIKRDVIFQIPKNGERLEDIGKLTKANLKPASNLKIIFKRLLNTLYSNTNISRREKLGNEMIRLIFCKIWDEKYEPNSLPKFRVGFEENARDVKTRITDLFKLVKSELVEDGVFDENEEIKLDDKSVSYVVGELERYSLLKTEKDVVGDAFEVFAESKLVGEKGEFFTPREVVKTAVQIVNPQPGDTIFDPACGSGGFLIYAIEHIWKTMELNIKYKGLGDNEMRQAKKEVAEKTIFGIDKEIDLVKIAKAYMSIIGDGRSRIAQQNTLHTSVDFEGKAKELFVNNVDNTFKKFDVILTNPPFGNKIKVMEEDSKYFELGHVWKRQGSNWIKTFHAKETEPQVLFIERCLEMLKDGGKLAIILPETYFHAPNAGYVLDYIKKNNNITAVVDLAHNTFRPYNNAKTILLILEKGRPQQQNIIMAVTEEIGHDHNGKLLYRYDKQNNKFSEKIWDDTEIVRAELGDPANTENKNVFVVNVNDITNNVYVPRYYWHRRIKELREEAKKRGMEFVQIKDLISSGIIADFPGHGSPAGKYKGQGTIPYIRVADIVNWSIYRNPTSAIPEQVYVEKKANGIDLEKEDVLFVRRGSYRIGSVALVSPFDTKVLLTREIHVFRIKNKENKYGIDAFYLLYLFSHELTQKQLYNKVMIDTTLPNIGRRWEELYFPILENKNERDNIKNKIRQAFEKRWQAQEEIINLQKEFGNLTT